MNKRAQHESCMCRGYDRRQIPSLLSLCMRAPRSRAEPQEIDRYKGTVKATRTVGGVSQRVGEGRTLS